MARTIDLDIELPVVVLRPEPQVQADWNQNDTEAPDFINNKPFYDYGETTYADVAISSGTFYFNFSVVPVAGETYVVEEVATGQPTSVREITASSYTQYDQSGVMFSLSNGSLFYTPSFSAEGQADKNGKFNGNPAVTHIKIYKSSLKKLDNKFLSLTATNGTGTNSFIINWNGGTNPNIASGDYACAEGLGTKASHKSQTVCGEYNIQDPSSSASQQRGTYVEIVGNGTSNNARSNARTLDWSGNEQIAGTLRIGSTSTGGVLLKEDSGSLKISFDNGTTWLTVQAS